MNENEYWAKFWKIIGVSICVTSAVISGCNGTLNYQDNNAIVEMVAKGADPLDARCSIKQDPTLCTLRAATKNKQGG